MGVLPQTRICHRNSGLREPSLGRLQALAEVVGALSRPWDDFQQIRFGRSSIVVYEVVRIVLERFQAIILPICQHRAE